MFYLEELPNELILIIFSYLRKSELIESFIHLNKRVNNLLLKYLNHINLSSILTRNEFNQYLKLNSSIDSLTIENYQIGNDFLQKFQFDRFYRIKLLDKGIDLLEEISQKFQPEILTMVITSLNQENKHYQFFSTSLKRVEIEFHIGEYAKNCLLNQFHFFSPSILVDIRITFSKLSEYFQVFNYEYSIHIEKLSVSIFSIDRIDSPQTTICLPNLIDFQLEICQIPFHLLEYLLPINKKMNCLKRFAFLGRTTTISAKAWKILLSKYHSIEHFDLHLSDIKSFQFSDIQEWKCEFPMYSIDYNSLKKSFAIHSSKFDRFERLLLNESIENVDHIEYLNKIHHLIIRSQYWCSYIHLSFNIQNDLLKNFNHIKRLTTTSRQLEYFLSTKLLNQIEQLDLEFSEKYCLIPENVAEEFIQLKSLSLSSIYDGIHQIDLHSTIKEILFVQFSKIIYLYIDAIQIIDDEYVENTISQWYSSQSNQPIIHYSQGKSLSIWF